MRCWKKWSDSWLVDTDHAWCCLLCCWILETSVQIPKQPLISPASFCKLSLSNVSRLSVCRPWKDKYIIKEDDGDDLDGHGVVAPGHLAHPVPPLTQHKVLLQRRKFVDVQNLKNFHEKVSFTAKARERVRKRSDLIWWLPVQCSAN